MLTTKKVEPHLEKENAANPGGTNLPDEFPTSSLTESKGIPICLPLLLFLAAMRVHKSLRTCSGSSNVVFIENGCFPLALNYWQPSFVDRKRVSYSFKAEVIWIAHWTQSQCSQNPNGRPGYLQEGLHLLTVQLPSVYFSEPLRTSCWHRSQSRELNAGRTPRGEIRNGSSNPALSLQRECLGFSQGIRIERGIHHMQAGTALKSTPAWHQLHQSACSSHPKQIDQIFICWLTNRTSGFKKPRAQNPKIYFHISTPIFSTPTFFYPNIFLWVNDSKASLFVSKRIKPSTLHALTSRLTGQLANQPC